MAEIGVVLIADQHYGVVRNQFSLLELIRNYTNTNYTSNISYRHIVSKNISSLCNVYPNRLEDLRSFVRTNRKNIFYICVGLSNYKSGYNFKMFKNHYRGLIKELNLLSEEVQIVLVCGNINNKLKGHFLSNYNKFTNITNEVSIEEELEVLRPDIKILFLNNGDYVISTKTIENMVESIGKSIYELS